MSWPEDVRTSAEAKEVRIFPSKRAIVESSNVMISATLSPISLEAGLQTLRDGGTAADAAIVVALTQIATCGGSVVSYAGIAEVMYYDAQTRTTHNLNGPWKSYIGESDPQSIPLPKDISATDQGRKTFVPGFMAAMGAFHERFGALPWEDLFAPSIYYTENGVPTSGMLAFAAKMQKPVLERTPEGRSFLQPNGNPLPKRGELFYQPDTAKTLRAIAEQGARYMYEGEWAKRYVEKVRAYGGEVSLDDLKSYKASWQVPLESDFAGYTVKTSGIEAKGGHQLLLGLNLAAELNLVDEAPYWESAESFFKLAHVCDLIEMDPEAVVNQAAEKGVALDLNERYMKAYARQVIESVRPNLQSIQGNISDHTNAIVVVDQNGNIASLTHTINTGLWGRTGIVVDGIPISDPAAGLVARKREIIPGTYLGNGLSPAIVFEDENPVFAIAGVGAISRELTRILINVLGHDLDLPSVIEAPKWLFRIGSRKGKLAIEEEKFSEKFLSDLENYGLKYSIVSSHQAGNLCGTATFVELPVKSDSGNRNPVELRSYITPKRYSFADGY